MTACTSVSEGNGRQPASKKPVRRRHAAGGMNLGADNGREAQRLAVLILEVLAGARTPAQAATALAVSVPRYYQLESRALRGLVEACEPKPRGRLADPQRELAALHRQHERLQRELARQQSLVRLAQRTIGLAAPGKGEAAASATAGSGKGKKRRRRAVVRALGAAAQLQERGLAEAVSSGGPEPSA